MAIYGCGISSDYLDWLPIIGLLLLISFFMVSLVYMLAQITKRQDWAFWAKNELWQTLVSCLLVGIIISFVGTICIISENVAGGDPFQISQQYIQETLWGRLVPAVDNLFKLSFKAQRWAAFTIGLISCNQGVCFQPYAGFGTLSYNFETMAAIVTPFGASLLFQKIFLQFVQEIAFTIVLPIGLILKVFPFTREAGAFLIAAAIAFYAVYPLTYVFNAIVMEEVVRDPDVSSWCDDSLVGFGGGSSGLGYSTCQSLSTIGQILPQAVFLPALNLIITISFMQVFTRLLSRDYLEAPM